MTASTWRWGAAPPCPPITGSPGVMCKCDDHDFGPPFNNHDVKWKAFETQPFYAAGTCCRGNRSEWYDPFLNEIECGIHGSLEVGTETGSLSLVPLRRLDRLLRGFRVQTELTHYGRLVRSRIRRENSSRSINAAVPDSISSRRRSTSVSQERSASESTGPSRLATKSWASSARSAAVKSSASARTLLSPC